MRRLADSPSQVSARVVVVARNHTLADQDDVTLEELGDFLVAHVDGVPEEIVDFGGEEKRLLAFMRLWRP